MPHHKQDLTRPCKNWSKMLHDAPAPPAMMTAPISSGAWTVYNHRESRRQDCARGSTVSAPLQDLQEMHNAMMATVPQIHG
jgi:hypothetical protein